MSHSDQLPFGVTLVRILRDDLHYVQRAAHRTNEKSEDTLHKIIENHRYPGGAGE